MLLLTGWVLIWTMDAALSEDKKQVVPGPLDAVGRIDVDGGRFCTGVLIAQRQVLTAAHCLWDEKVGRWMAAYRIRFRAGFDRAGGRGEARALSYLVAPQYDPTRATEPASLAEDWALIDLDDGLKGAVSPLPVMTLDRARFIQLWSDRAPIDMAGYRADRAHAMTLAGGCRLLGLDGKTGTLLHDCVAPHGASGSPILARLPNGYAVVGLHVASASLKGKRVAVAAPVRPAAPVVALLD